ncbi:MAG TPA: DUF72 domain-containing protein [Candidatus Acidoferrales bacterium]|nr:DUF72 domain-containing protein [Candidatus Acidoferrales bacterium]
MKVYAGTSGYGYKEWRGNFYPRDLPAREMLGFFATRLPAVEINNTFYRLPSGKVLQAWADQVPEDFRFAIKASQRITHLKRLKGAEEETRFLLRSLEALGARLGVVLFQLPPQLRKDCERLRHFLGVIPPGVRAAFEFRHPSWLADDVLAILNEHGAVWCVADTEEAAGAIVEGGACGYLRLRRAHYSDAELRLWVERVLGQPWDEAYVFFKHEDAGIGPALAQRFLELARARQR